MNYADHRPGKPTNGVRVPVCSTEYLPPLQTCKSLVTMTIKTKKKKKKKKKKTYI